MAPLLAQPQYPIYVCLANGHYTTIAMVGEKVPFGILARRHDFVLAVGALQSCPVPCSVCVCYESSFKNESPHPQRRFRRSFRLSSTKLTAASGCSWKRTAYLSTRAPRRLSASRRSRAREAVLN